MLPFHYERIQHLAKNKMITGLPSTLPHMQHPCPTCLQVKSHKLPRRPNNIYNDFQPEEALHMDYELMSQPSIRGFTAFLAVKDAATNYTWVFPTRNKRPPLDIVKYLLAILQKENRPTTYVRVDEDGALANNTEFCKLLHTSEIHLQGTGGYASDKNGKTESLNKALKHATLTALTSSNTPLDFWCFAMQHSNSTIHNMSLNPQKTKTASESWTNRKSDWKEFRIPFCDVYIVTKPDNKNSNIRHTFLAFGPTTSVVYYWDKNKRTVKIGHNAYFDDYSSGNTPQEETPGSRLIKNESSTLSDIKLDKEPIKHMKKYMASSPHTSSPFKLTDLFIHIFPMKNLHTTASQLNSTQHMDFPSSAPYLQQAASINTYLHHIDVIYG